MKKILFLLCFVSFVVTMKAQAPFSIYTPVSPYGSQQQYNGNSMRQENYQTVTGYYINQRGAFQKIRLKINVVNAQIGGASVYVRAYMDPRTGSWSSCNNRATEVTQYSNDPAVIKENFDYKCYILNIGNVYF